ncbi:MAG: hypothetical protein AAF593_00675 [Planctomycetota bacterium]
MHLSAACSRLRVLIVPRLDGGLVSRYDLERGIIEIAEHVIPSERPRAAAGAIIRIELDRILRHRPVAERESIAGLLSPVMARFAMELEDNGGMMRWYQPDGSQGAEPDAMPEIAGTIGGA